MKYLNFLSEIPAELSLMVQLIFGLLGLVSIGLVSVGKVKPTWNLSELKLRTKSWWFMSAVFLAAILINHKISFIALAYLSFLAFREMYSLMDFRSVDRRAIFWALVSIPVQFYLAFIGWYGAFIIFIPVVMFLFLSTTLVLSQETDGITQSIAKIHWSLMLTVFGLSHLAYLLSLGDLDGFSVGPKGLILYVVVLTEINDILQFTSGKIFGKRGLTRVSPNKTLEGLIGGVLLTTIIAYFLNFLTPMSGIESALMGLIIALSGFAGDLLMSAIKRDFGKKDTGSTIPGHGGILDRVDSLIFTAPIFFHIIYYIYY